MAEWKRCARHGARQPCAECRRIGEVNRDLRALTDDERIAIWLHGVEGWNA